MSVLLTVENLQTHYKIDCGIVKAVDGVSYHVNEREIIGFVGESGCGKSVTQLSIMQLISPPGKITSGKVIFENKNLLKFEPKGPEMRSIRGAKIAMIFQEPMTSLNPVMTINRQLTEMLKLHMGMSIESATKRVIELLHLVGIPGAEKRIYDYPHQFSGGMRQRVMIAMGLSCNPKILIADEPTTALDVTTQAQLLELMKKTVERFNTSLVIVTHNMGVVARYAKRLYIMYAGRIVEAGTTKDIFSKPRHPYTIGLLKCIPRLDEEEGARLIPIHGLPPNLINMPPTCAFLPRCAYRIKRCFQDPWPPLLHLHEQHYVSCYANTGENVNEHTA